MKSQFMAEYGVIALMEFHGYDARCMGGCLERVRLIEMSIQEYIVVAFSRS